MNTFKLKDIAKAQKKHFIVSQCAIAFETLIELQLPLILAIIMDRGLLQNDFSIIAYYAAIYIFLLILRGSGIVLFGYSSAYASNGIAADLRIKTFAHINKLRLTEVNSIGTGSLITRLTSDIDIIQNSTNLLLRILIRAPLNVIGGILMLLFLNGQFSIILAVSMVILSIVIGVVIKKTQPIYKKIQEKTDDLNTIAQEDIVGLRIIKSFCGKKFEEERFKESNAEASENVFRVQRLVSLMSPSFTIVMNMALVTLLYIGSQAVYGGTLEIGEIMASISYLTQILFSLVMLVMIFPSLSRAYISLQRIKAVFSLKLEQEFEDENTSSSKAIEKKHLNHIEKLEFSSVSFTYPYFLDETEKEDKTEKKAVLNHLNFSVCKGEKIAFLGTTGSGKSTLIKILFGLYPASEGKVLLNGLPIENYFIKDVRNAMTYVLQRSDLFHGTIYENITFRDDSITQEQVNKATDIAQANKFIMDFEEQYERQLGSKGVGLSGGQKQRINLSRAFLKNSSLLILDDCTSALDMKTEKNVHKAIESTNMHSITILISQKVESVKAMDRIYLMDKGNIVASGSHNELLVSSSLYRDFCKSQSVATEKTPEISTTFATSVTPAQESL